MFGSLEMKNEKQNTSPDAKLLL